MCKWGTTEDVDVLITPELSYTGEARRAVKAIDACIADIVKALDAAGIAMCSSCCGHGQYEGSIELADGRTLVIKQADEEPDNGIGWIIDRLDKIENRLSSVETWQDGEDTYRSEHMEPKYCVNCMNYAKCGNQLFDYDTSEELDEAANDAGWERRDGRAICPECLEAEKMDTKRMK